MMRWYVLHTRSNFEGLVTDWLAGADIESYFPHRVEKSRDGKRDVVKPTFPGYTFARFELANRQPVIATSGVVRILGMGSGPAPISDQEIESIRIMVEAPVVYTPCPFVHEGEWVRVKWGPLAGATGIVLRLPKNKFKLVLSVEMMGRSVCSQIDAESCELLAPMSKAA